MDTRKDEMAELIYALDNNRILIIKIKSMGLAITEKLINMINIKTVKLKNFLILTIPIVM